MRRSRISANPASLEYLQPPPSWLDRWQHARDPRFIMPPLVGFRGGERKQRMRQRRVHALGQRRVQLDLQEVAQSAHARLRSTDQIGIVYACPAILWKHRKICKYDPIRDIPLIRRNFLD